MPGQILRPTGPLRTEDDYRESRFRPKSTALRRKRHRLTPYRVHQAETAPVAASHYKSLKQTDQSLVSAAVLLNSVSSMSGHDAGRDPQEARGSSQDSSPQRHQRA